MHLQYKDVLIGTTKAGHRSQSPYILHVKWAGKKVLDSETRGGLVLLARISQLFANTLKCYWYIYCDSFKSIIFRCKTIISLLLTLKLSFLLDHFDLSEHFNLSLFDIKEAV